MRILHLNQFSSRQGGAESYIADVAVALQTRGHESHLIAFTPNDADESIVTTTFAPVPNWPSPISAAANVLDAVIAKFRPDVAYLHAVYHPDLVTWIGQRLPTVAYVHGPYVVCPGSAQYLWRSMRVCPHAAGAICLLNAQAEKCCWGRNPIKHLRLLSRVKEFRHAYTHVKVIFVGSRFMQQLLVHGGISSDKIRILPPVLIHDPLPLASMTDDSQTVLYAGRLTAEKGPRHLIKALASVAADWRLIVAGDGPERQACHDLANQLGVLGKIQFKGWLNDRDMAQQFDECALVAFPSLWPEPFGRIGPEAYLYGKPVVAYSVGGIPEWLTHDVTGYLVEAGDTRALGQRLQALLESPALRAQMGHAARQTALMQWRAETHTQQLLHAFQDALGD